MEIKQRKKKSSFSESIFAYLNQIILILFALLCFYPIWFFFINSVSEPKAIAGGIYLWPKSLTFYNYRSLFEEVDNLLPAFKTSVLRTVFGTTVTCLSCSFVAFLVTQKELPFRKLIYRFIVITMYINAGLIPWFITMKMLHLNNSFLLYIIPSAITAFFVILLKTYFESLPAELQESAEIDGAGTLMIYAKVILPLSKPVIASVAVFSAVNQWNSWYDNFMLVTKDTLQTVQYLLYLYLTKNTAMTGNTAANAAATTQSSPMSIRITITLVTMLPIVIVYPIMQRYFVKGIMLGAVKG